METYAALLRGIMPTNPNMRNEKIKAVFVSLGLKNVTSVIASGNIIFQSTSRALPVLEKKIEQALYEHLGFKTKVMIRSHDDFVRLVRKNPFKNVEDTKPNYLVVTYFKDRRPELCTVIDLDSSKATDFMRKLEKQHGKDITTRTWKTVGRILKVMETLVSN